MILAVESFNKLYIIFALIIVGIASIITYIKVFQKHKLDEKKQQELLHNEKILDNPDGILKRKDEYIEDKNKEVIEQENINNEQVINDNQQNYIDQENQDNEDNSFKDNNMF